MLTIRLGSRLGGLGWGLLAGGLIAAACGNSRDTPVTSPGLPSAGARPGSGGKGGKGAGGGAGEGAGAGEGGINGGGDTTSTGGSSGTAGTGGSGGVAPGAPDVHVTSPAAVSDPNKPAVLVADELDALCTATKSTERGAKDVDPATVLLEMLDADGQVVETHPGMPTDNADEFTAHFVTRKVPDNGRISFACQASDSSNPPLVGLDQIDTFIDHGPKITAVAPALTDPPDATAVDQALHVAFKVAEAPVAKGDEGAAIDKVSLTVAGVPFDLTKSNGEYTATVQLNDPKLFSPTPDGPEKIVITASDQRSPKAATNQLAYDFVVDGSGPDIQIVSPHAGDVRSGKVQFVIKITDAQSGVDPLTVVATINNNDYPYRPDHPEEWSLSTDGVTYTFFFDTTQIEDSVAQATLQVVASDQVGNMSKASVLLQLDNVPPIVDMDPLPVRERKRDSGNCSLAFDPLGPNAANDLETVYDFQVFRALVWEETNHARGQTSGLAAGADLNSVVMYLQPNTDQGLLEDSDGDTYCDRLVTQDADTGKDLHSIALRPISPQGNPWFGPEGAEDPTLLAEFPEPDDCKYEGSTTSPQGLCTGNASDMTRVISWDVDHSVPVVFGVEPLTGLSCTGYGWEINSVVSEGWICAAATAMDNNGNVGISRPLRLCYDDGKAPAPNCSGSNAVPPPSCLVNNCKLPPGFGPAELLF